MSIFVGTGPSSYEKRIYRAAVSQRSRNTELEHCSHTPPTTLANKQSDKLHGAGYFLSSPRFLG